MWIFWGSSLLSFVYIVTVTMAFKRGKYFKSLIVTKMGTNNSNVHTELWSKQAEMLILEYQTRRGRSSFNTLFILWTLLGGKNYLHIKWSQIYLYIHPILCRQVSDYLVWIMLPILITLKVCKTTLPYYTE